MPEFEVRHTATDFAAQIWPQDYVLDSRGQAELQPQLPVHSFPFLFPTAPWLKWGGGGEPPTDTADVGYNPGSPEEQKRRNLVCWLCGEGIPAPAFT